MEKRYKLIEIPNFYCKNQEVHITEYHDGYSDCHILCKIDNEVCDEEHCNHKQLQLEGFTKEEMIEKMAIAILKADTPEDNENDVLLKLKLNDTHILKIYKIYAEAALNAMLEDCEK